MARLILGDQHLRRASRCGLDLVHPAVAHRRFVDEARQLRLDPFWRPIRPFQRRYCSRFRVARKGARNAFLLPFQEGRDGVTRCEATVDRGMGAEYSFATITC